MTNYPWLIQDYKRLTTFYQSERAHHALLLYQQAQTGAEALIQALAKELLCQNREPCDNGCQSCQLVDSGTHPDFYKLQRGEEKGSVGIDAVRTMSNRVVEYAQQGGNKVVWIPLIEELTEQAANALLKLLEEPRKNTYFILHTYHLKQLLPTVRSRCLNWKLKLPTEDVSLKWLKSQTQFAAISENCLLTALRLSAMSPVKAYELLCPDNWNRRAVFFATVKKAIMANDLFSLVESTSGQEKEILYWFSSLALDAMKWYYPNTTLFLVNLDQLSLIEQLAQRLSVQSLQKFYQSCIDCYCQLLSTASLNNELLLTDLLLRLERTHFTH